MERRRTVGKERREEELLLDDIVIERVEEDIPEASREHVTQSEGEEIILQGEDLHSADQFRVESPRLDHAPDRVLPNLEALSAEVDGISLMEEARGNVAEDGGAVDADRFEEYGRLEDLKIDDDIVIDLDAEANHMEKIALAPKKEKTADVQPVKPAHGHEDLHVDLLDDEFIILEESSISQSTLLEQNREASPLSESTESDIEEIIRASEIPVEGTPDGSAKAEDISGLSITLPEDVAKSLSEEFNIHSLEPVDLREAEKIANEDILILREEDLIEELDSIDLIPLDEGAPSEANAAALAKTATTKPASSHASSEKKAETHSDVSVVEVTAGKVHEPPVVSSKLPGGNDSIGIVKKLHEKPPRNAGREVEPVEVVAQSPLVIEDVLSIADDAKKEHLREDTIEIPILLEADAHELREIEASPELNPPAIEITDEMPGDTFSESDSVSSSRPDDREAAGVFEEDMIHIRPQRGVEEPVLDATVRFEETFELEDGRPPVREKIPDEFLIASERGRVLIIDDVAVEKTFSESESIFADGELEKSTVGLVDIIEGSARFIREASVEEDQEQMASIMSGTAMAFEDLLVDFSEEYKFKDEDVDFIDNVFIAESASLAGVSSDVERRRKRSMITPATEIFGLSDAELFEIEMSVFTGEYKEIDLSKVKGALPVGLDQAPVDFALVKNCHYLGASSSEIAPMEKKSIEEDVVADQALVFEESVEDIRRVLLNYRKTKKQHSGDVLDISDEIVIIDDKSDIERFADTFEPEKRDNIKKLLQYLDGLFEKLPEDVIRKFAESEYYNLYIKIMKELER